MAVTAKPRNRLTGLQIHAAAGVDHGANREQMGGAEGWMVIKADVAYADPGYQDDKKSRYPIDTAEHVRAAWSYINQAKNRTPYSDTQLSQIESRIKAAAKRLSVDIAEAAKAASCPECDAPMLAGVSTCPNGHDVAKAEGGPVADTPTREALAKAVTDAQAELTKAQEAVAKSATDETRAAVAKASDALVAAIVAKSEADDARITELETAAAAAPTEVSDEVDELQKALDDPTTPEVLKAALRKQAEVAEDARKQAADAIAKAEAERDARVAKEFVAKAEGFDGLPGAKADDFGPILRAVAEKCGDEVFASLETILRGASDTCKASDLLREVGTSFASGSGAGDAYAQLTAKAAEIRQTAVAKGEDMTRERAMDLAYQLNPELVAAHKKETS